MLDFDIITSETPVVKAAKKNDSIALLSGKPYIYHKAFDITEFIGEKLASIRNVRTAHYFPICFGNVEKYLNDDVSLATKVHNVRVGSYDFKGSGIGYAIASSLPYYKDYDSFNILLEKCKDDENREVFIDENLEMFALDTYMGQIDRNGNVYYEFHPNGEVHLGTLFDYELSLKDGNLDEIDYESDFFRFRSVHDYHQMMAQYPQFREYLESYLSISLVEQIGEMAEERKFSLENFDLDPYMQFDEATHKRLEKILK